MRALAHRHDVSVSRKQRVAAVARPFLVTRTRSSRILTRCLGARGGNEAQVFENGGQSSASGQGIEFNELFGQILRHAAGTRVVELKSRSAVFRGRGGRMETAQNDTRRPARISRSRGWLPALPQYHGAMRNRNFA